MRCEKRVGLSSVADVTDDVAVQWRPITVADGPRGPGSCWRSRSLRHAGHRRHRRPGGRSRDVGRGRGTRGTMAVFSAGDMIAFAGLRSSPSVTGRHEMDLYGGVHPAHRGRGLGTRLLAWAEQAALPLHQARHPDHPLALSASCPDHQEDALALLAAAGYQRARWFHFMSRGGTWPDPFLTANFPTVPGSPDTPPPSRKRPGGSGTTRFAITGAPTPETAESWQHSVGHERFRPEFSFLAYLGDDPSRRADRARVRGVPAGDRPPQEGVTSPPSA